MGLCYTVPDLSSQDQGPDQAKEVGEESLLAVGGSVGRHCNMRFTTADSKVHAYVSASLASACACGQRERGREREMR